MKCPKCEREVDIRKYALFNCQCGCTLMVVEINKVKQVVDVTKEEE